MRYDLHAHSKYSPDSVLEPERIVKTAIKRGLSGIAVTDHNTIKGGLKAKKYETEDFAVIVGSEIKTARGEIIGLFLEEEVKPAAGDFQELVSAIKRQNGIVVIPHPFDELRRSALHPTEEDAKFVDCIECFNSRCIFQRYNDRAVEFAAKHRLPVTAGSDAHFANEIGNAGIITEAGITETEAGITEAGAVEEVREALRKNEVQTFGRRSSLVNHIGSKVVRIWKKAVRFG